MLIIGSAPANFFYFIFLLKTKESASLAWLFLHTGRWPACIESVFYWICGSRIFSLETLNFDCAFNGAGGFYAGRTLVKGLFASVLLTFGTLRLVGRQLHGHKCCYVNHVALLHWDSITISCFIHTSGCYAAFYGAAVLVERPFCRDCNFLCVRLHAV